MAEKVLTENEFLKTFLETMVSLLEPYVLGMLKAPTREIRLIKKQQHLDQEMIFELKGIIKFLDILCKKEIFLQETFDKVFSLLYSQIESFHKEIIRIQKFLDRAQCDPI